MLLFFDLAQNWRFSYIVKFDVSKVERQCAERYFVPFWFCMAGSGTNIVFVELWSHKKFDNPEPPSDSAYSLASFGEKFSESLESSCSEFDTECEKDLLRCWSSTFWWMLGEIPRRWSQGQGNTGEVRVNLEAFRRSGCFQRCKQWGRSCLKICVLCCHYFKPKGTNICWKLRSPRAENREFYPDQRSWLLRTKWLQFPSVPCDSYAERDRPKFESQVLWIS